MKGDVLAFDGSFQGARLARPFESTSNFVSILFENDGLFGAPGCTTC
jgi:hypothetical protein